MEAADKTSCIEIVNYYKCRWEIEIYFKILKSGCNVENLHLEEAERLKTALGLYMILSWRIFYVMMLSRRQPKLPADEIFDMVEIKLIYSEQGKRIPNKPPSLGKVAVMLAQMGGNLARKNDPPPGPKAFWVAFDKLSHNLLVLSNLERCV